MVAGQGLVTCGTAVLVPRVVVLLTLLQLFKPGRTAGYLDTKLLLKPSRTAQNFYTKPPFRPGRTAETWTLIFNWDSELETV